MKRSDLRVFTCSVYPDLTRVWYQVLVRTFDGTPPDTLIFDCGGGLREADFPGATIRRVPNWDHGRKIDLALTQLVGDAPVLVVGSPDDRIVPRRSLEKTARRYGGAPLLFPGMGHDLMLEARWQEPIDAILDWLDKST